MSLSLVVLKELGELLLEGFDLGAVADLDIGVVGVVEGVVLVVAFGVVEAQERGELSDDRLGKDMGRVKLRDVGHADLALVFAGIKDRRAIGCADVIALAVELGGVVGDGEEDAQKLAVGDLRGVVDDAHRFGVAGGLGGDLCVGRGRGRAAGVTGGGGEHALDALEDRLRPPEASSGEYGRLPAWRGGQLCIGSRSGNRASGRMSA